jgi:hypothetical protein
VSNACSQRRVVDQCKRSLKSHGDIVVRRHLGMTDNGVRALVGEKPLSSRDKRKAKRPLSLPDKRKAKRLTVHYSAWVLLVSGRPPVECVIRDMSDSGARLVITSPITFLPQRFSLWLDKKGKVQRECKVVWARAPYLGVSFAARGPLSA